MHALGDCPKLQGIRSFFISACKQERGIIIIYCVSKKKFKFDVIAAIKASVKDQTDTFMNEYHH